MGSELVRLLEQEARVEKDKVLTEARARAEAILASAGREAEETLAEARRRLEAEQAQARTRASSTASLRAAALVLEAKDAMIRKVFERAEAELRAVAEDPGRRRAAIRQLLREAAQGLTGRAVVEVPQGDAQVAKEVSRDLGLEIDVRENAAVTDGIRLISQDGRLVIENTLSSRLARARLDLVSRVAEILWGA
jgi:vacuolar-type H+-ATPase subunit E/Vma4